MSSNQPWAVIPTRSQCWDGSGEAILTQSRPTPAQFLLGFYPPQDILPTSEGKFKQQELVLKNCRCSYRRPRGPMDKASAYGAEDCKFDPCRGRLTFFSNSEITWLSGNKN